MSAPSSRRRWCGCGLPGRQGGALKAVQRARRRPRARRGRGIFHRAARRLATRFVFAGEVLRFEGLRETDAIVTRAHATEPKVPSYDGGKFPLSTYLAERVRGMLADPAPLVAAARPGLGLAAAPGRAARSCPAPTRCWSRPSRAGRRHYLVCYPFEGRLAHQTLGMLLTRRLERAGAAPLGFVANEYALAVWALDDMGEMVQTGRLDLAQTVRRGHARRRSRCLARRVEPDEAHLPRLRHHLRPDRAPPSRAGEDRAADDGLLRSDLRRAAPARARTTSCSRPPSPMRQPACIDVGRLGRILAANQRANQAYCACAEFRRSRCRSCSRSAAKAFQGRRVRSCCARRLKSSSRRR